MSVRNTGLSDLVELIGELVHQTEKAWLVKFHPNGTAKTVWLPKVAVEREGDNVWIMPEGLAMEKEIV